MAEKKQNDDVTNAELVADDPGLTKPPTGIILEDVNPEQPSIVKEAEEEEKNKK